MNFVLKIKSFFTGLSFSAKALLFCFLIIWWFNFNIKRWKNLTTISYDVVSYYAYLPALFVHNDLTLQFVNTDGIDYRGKSQFWPIEIENGSLVIKTTMGLSFLYLPFFLIAHGIAWIYGFPTDGFSYPYHKYIHLSGVIYFFIGLFYLRKLLLRYFNDKAVGYSILLLVFGTTFFYYSTHEAALSHLYNFSLSVIFIYTYDLFIDKPHFLKSILIGLVFGLMILIRPVNILFGLFFMLYRVYKFYDLKERMMLVFNSWPLFLTMVVLSVLVQIPQLLYWKYLTGHYFFNSYVGEWFYFNKPHITEVLFSYRKGWLLYTPIMIFAIVGFIIPASKPHRFSVFIFFMVFLYVISSWWCWWYGGCFGMRPMMDIYSVLALPFTAFIVFVQQQKQLFKKLLSALIVLACLESIHNYKKYRSGAIHWDSMTKEAYWDSFFRMDKSADFQLLIKAPDYEKARLSGSE
jgi:hypothetical protein